jgi:uncharacterized protein YjbI with pentapeptide repeats
MSIVKPLRLGLLARTHRQPPKVYHFVAAVGYFDLLDPTDFGLETEMWPTIIPALGSDMLDACMPKPAGEFLVAGDACAPAGETVRQAVVDIQLGAIKKRLAVFGDRAWMHAYGGPVFTRPAPFERMPMTWENAFGGPRVDVNPTGKGADANADLREGRPAMLPNVEDPSNLILGIGDEPRPVGVRPMAMDHPDRMKHVGTVDDSYLIEQFPGHPMNFDWAFYHNAAIDQRASGYLSGDEPIRVTGMHPEHQVISSRLPAMRARAFVNLDKGQGETEFREIKLRCETVWLFPSLLKGVVIYRGGCEIGDIDGLDVKDTMLVYERMAEEPRSIEHYLVALKERTDPDTAALKFFDEKPLRPELTAEQTAQREAEVAAAEAEEERKRNKRTELAIIGGFRAVGLPPPPLAAIPKPAPLPVKIPVVTPQSIARMEIDMAGIMQATKDLQAFAAAEVKAVKAKALQEASTWLLQAQKQTSGLIPTKQAAKLAEAAKFVATSIAKLDPPVPGLPDGGPAEQAASMDEGTTAAIGAFPSGDDALARLTEGMEPETVAELEAALAALEAKDAEGDEIETEIRLARARALRLPEGALLAPMRDQLDQLSPEGLAERFANAPEGMDVPDLAAAIAAPPKPTATGNETDLADADAFLASLGIAATDPLPPSSGGSADDEADDVSAMAKARDTVKSAMEASPLAAHAMGAAAQVEPVPMATALDEVKASLDEADEKLDEGLGTVRLISPEAIFPLKDMAEPVSINLGALILELKAQGQSLAGRDLAGAYLVGADLSGLDLSGVKLEKADLRGAKLTASNLKAAALTEAKLDGADFTGAILAEANLSSVSAHETIFAKADMRNARMMMADLTRADFSGCRLGMTQILKATLTGANFADAELDRLAFLQSEMKGVVLDRARLKGCIFIEIDLEGLSARSASLSKCAIISVSAEKADFSGADLSDTALIGGTNLNGGTFRDLVALRSGWRQASLVGADFTAARLDGADMGEADLTDAQMPRASFKGAILSSAILERADLAATNLFEAQARRVNLVHASLRRANLFSANMDEADLAFCDMTGANLNRTMFARPGRVA